MKINRIDITHPKTIEPFKSLSILYILKPDVKALVVVIETNINVAM